jgi:hypothetical protein
MAMPESAIEEAYGVAKGVTYDWTVNVVVSAIFIFVGCTYRIPCHQIL